MYIIVGLILESNSSQKNMKEPIPYVQHGAVFSLPNHLNV